MTKETFSVISFAMLVKASTPFIIKVDLKLAYPSRALVFTPVFFWWGPCCSSSITANTFTGLDCIYE
jgi:hypothetical protein